MTERTRVTLKDIAKECGYAVNTISRAMRGDARLPLATRERIREVAGRMGYIPNHLASALRSGTSHMVAVIVNDIHNQHYSSLLSDIDEYLRQEGYTMMTLCMQLDKRLAQQMIHMAIAQGVDGILYFPYFYDSEHIDALEKNRMPFVLIDRWIEGVHADTAMYDDRQAGYLAGSHLARLGHERFAYMSGVLNVSSQFERKEGFLRALNDAHIPETNVRDISWEATTEALERGRLADLLSPIDYTAIVTFNDELGYHALNMFSEMGVAVPEDISIISFDHIRSYYPYMQPLTSISAADENVARVAVKLLLNRLRDPLLPPQIEVLPVKICDDGTTARPREIRI